MDINEFIDFIPPFFVKLSFMTLLIKKKFFFVYIKKRK